MKFKFLLCLFLISSFLLLVYSFSQVDLNLTLSSNSAYQFFQKQLTDLGYYHRPFSTATYIILVSLLGISYWLVADAVKHKTTTTRQVWILIGLIVVILLPSYPAFSHDIFNYLFDARIVTKYELLPWHYKPLDFPQDDWIRFMRWTHRPSVYPPIWIGLSLIPSFLGMGKFILTLGLFKLMIAGAYLGSGLLIYKIARKLRFRNPLFPVVLYSFNPLVVIEALINAHMEFVMIFFGLAALNFYLNQKKAASWLALVASLGIKYMTIFLVPVLLKGKIWLRRSIWLGLILTIAWIAYYGFQPWYLLWVLPFIYLLPPASHEIKLITLLSFTTLFWNIPLVASGDFNLPTWQSRLGLVIIPFLLGLSLWRSLNKVKKLKLV